LNKKFNITFFKSKILKPYDIEKDSADFIIIAIVLASNEPYIPFAFTVNEININCTYDINFQDIKSLVSID
jgi:hypothetical protein